MDLIITGIIVVLVLSMIIGSLIRGVQRFVGLAILFVAAALFMIRASGGSLATVNTEQSGSSSDAPMVAIKALDDFTQAMGSAGESWIASQTDGTNGNSFPSGTPGNGMNNGNTGTGADNGTGIGNPGTNSNTDSQDPIPAWW